MSAKQEYEAQRPFSFEEETETSETSTRRNRQGTTKKNDDSPEKKRMKPFRYIFATAAIAGAFLLMGYRNNTAIWVKDANTSPEGYLALTEYRIYTEMNEDITLNNTLFKDNCYVNDFKYPDAITAQGLKPNSSWDQFVEVYGDYYYSDAYFSLNYNEEKLDGEVGYFFINEDLTIRELDEKYIQSGAINLTRYHASIEFEAVVWGDRIAYTPNEKATLRSRHYDSNWPNGSWFNPKIQSYRFDFEFRKGYADIDTDKQCELDCFSLYKNSY